MLPVLVRGSGVRGPFTAVCALVSAFALLFGVALFVTALLPIERHRTDHVVEEMFFRAVALAMIILGVALPICEAARIPSFIDALLRAYRDYKQDPQPAKKEDMKAGFRDDLTARAIRLAFVAFVPVGGLLLFASYGTLREREYG